jgi:pimeloyl-ACP methyl ester carboxylesterase
VRPQPASPENALRIRRALDEIEIAALLPDVRVPTLVRHCRNDAVQPFEEDRRMAAGISGSPFVALEGSNHLLEHEPAWEVTRFLGT